MARVTHVNLSFNDWWAAWDEDDESEVNEFLAQHGLNIQTMEFSLTPDGFLMKFDDPDIAMLFKLRFS